MSREKRAELHRLDNEARKALDDPWEIDELHAVDPPSSFENNRERAQHVVATKEYPATFTMWTQLLVGVMVPKALQLVLAAV